MKKMIISWETYNWAECLSGIISREPKKFDVLVVCKDNNRTIGGCNRRLCKEAIYSQRSDDLFHIGTELKLRKLMNLAHDENNPDATQLIAQIQLHAILGGIGEIYYDKTSNLLTVIAKEIGKKIEIETYGFSNTSMLLPIKRYRLSDEEFELKRKILRMMIGYPYEAPILYKEEVLFK